MRAVSSQGAGSPHACRIESHKIEVALSWDNGATYTAFKSQTLPNRTFNYFTLGLSFEPLPWGRAWSPSDFSNANFVAKVRYKRIPPCASGLIALDHIQVKVYSLVCEPVDCADDDACTDDTCVNGVCVHINNTASCDDGSSCTQGDVCSNGVCTGGNPNNAFCQEIPDNVCTTDACAPGVAGADPLTGCVRTNNINP